MKWKEKNVFITGADGFIGSWIAKELVEKEANVTILTRDLKKESGYKLLGLEKNLNIVQGNLTDYLVLERVLNEYSIDTCFHLAAQALVQIASKSPLSTFESNIRGTYNLLEACRNTTIERVVVASSDKAYGVQKKLPYTEDSPLLGFYPYDASKVCTDILARSYFISYGLPVAVTRCANVYGGGDLNFSRIVPDAIRCVLEGKTFLIRSDGTPERDYMYIKDAVSAYLTLAENLHTKKVEGHAFNFGSGKPISVLDLFRLIAKKCGKPDAKFKILGQARNEIDRQWLVIDKAKKILGWEPKWSLEAGLTETIKWYKDYLGR
jgi:CDP-glucose 4,6-dehydratase